MTRWKKQHWIGTSIVIAFLALIAYFFISTGSTKEIPAYVSEEMRELYTWANTTQGRALLEVMPCYCGCKYAGHLHARHCFWRDDGTFDKHGLTCSVCFDIGTKTKEMSETGKTACEIRKDIDDFYAPNKELSTDTPMPAGC